MKFTKLSNNNAFTLLEVMLSLSIVSISVIFILQTFIRFADSQRTLERYTKACYLLDMKLSEIKRNPIGSFKKEGVFAEPFENYTWSLSAKGKSSTLNHVKLTVSWPNNNGTRSIDATTIYPEPTSP